MDLYPINLARLSVVESAAFINRFIEDFEKSGLNANDETDFKEQLDELILQLPTYIKAVTQIKARAETAELKRIDVHRDRKFAMVKRLVSAYEHSDEEAQRTAYHQIWIIIKHFKSLKNANYMAETLAIKLLIKSIRTAKNDAMSKLFLEPFIISLELANEAFIATFNKRSSREIDTVKYNTTELRDTIFDTYKALANYVLIMAPLKKTPFYNTSLKILNNGREYFNRILKRRNGGDKE